jgi:Malectin domain/PKD domain
MHMRMRAAKIGLALFVTAAIVVPVGAAVASGVDQSNLVSMTPSTHTPNINDGTVFAITQVGTQIIVGGSFTNVDPPGDTNSADAVTRNYILSFDQSTGVVSTTFVPVLDGIVRALKPGPTPNTVYVGGEFDNVNGVKAKSVALLSTTTGLMVAGFKPAPMDGVVWALNLTGGHLIIGGIFTALNSVPHAGIGSLNPTTGAVDPYMTTQLTGHHNYTGQPGQANAGVGVHKMDVSPDGTKLVITGNFKMADGVVHDQIALINLGATSATLDTDWNTDGYDAACASNAFDTYMRDTAFSTDGTYFVVAATGGGTFSQNPDGTRSLCDTVTRWSTTATGTDVQPQWIDYSGNDSFESITTTGAGIYAGGHERWVNNGSASDSAGEGSVPRPGIAVLDPVNGLPFSWNPGRNPRGSGAYAVFATPTGLYLGDDTPSIGTGSTYVVRSRIVFFPLTGGESIPSYAQSTLPATVYQAGQLPTTTNTNVLYRVDAGGPTIPAIDNGPDWVADQSDPSPYRDSTSSYAGWSQVPNINPIVPSTTPSGIFNSERYGNQNWTFPVTAGTPIEVRLYFANRYTGTSQVGQRVFDVSLDGTVVQDHYDIVADTGDQTGTMHAYDINAPASGDVTIGLSNIVENPLINGIEIIRTDIPAPPSSAFDILQKRSFTGTAVVGGTTTVDSGTIAWSKVRGAFLVGNELFYGYSDGNFYEASFDGTTVGTPALVDPYDDPIWSNIDTGSGQTYRGVETNIYGAEMQSVTGMVYDAGKLYYSLAGQTQLHYRYFEPDDGIIGTVEFTAGGTSDLSNIKGMFLANNTLYYADAATGNLHSVAWDAGAPDATTDAVVSGPATDGNDWRTRGMFATTSPAPVAAFSTTCTAMTCAVDATASTAPGSSITGYSWTFGDGTTATGVTASDTYATAGTYSVTLTVTNALGATAASSQQVQPAPAATPIAFVASATTNANAATETVTVPSAVTQGDGLLLFATGATAGPLTGPTGWTLVGTSPSGAVTTSVWERVATGTDAGTTVSVGFGGTVHGTVQLVAYSGTDTTAPVLQSAVNSASAPASMTTPTLTDSTSGTWVVSYWTTKSSVVTTWTVPASQTSRSVANGTGSGRINSVIVDSGTPVSQGTVGGLTATTDQTAGATDSWTIVLKP